MKKNIFYYGMLLAAAFAFTFTSCTKDDDDDAKGSNSDVPADSQAGVAPEVIQNTVVLPNISAPSLEGNNAVVRISFTGVKSTQGSDAGKYMHLYGTGSPNQNVWLTIDGKPKSVLVINSEDVQQQTKGMADVVFLIDDSGSMDEEADSVAKQVVFWSSLLAQTLDCRFGVVGYGDGYYGIDGAMNLNVIDSLDYYLNDRPGRWSEKVYGTSRTMGFWGKDSLRFHDMTQTRGDYYNSSYNECGALALHFADEQFSVETLNANDTLYNWNPAKGTVHSVYSGYDSLQYKAPDGYRYLENLNRPFYNSECPFLMSEYTGGVTIFADPYFKGVTLTGLEVTGAMSNSYVLRFNVTDDLRTGTHVLEITIKDAFGNMAKKRFENVTFELQ